MITFHKPIMAACSLCTASGYYDSLNDTTIYFTCPICSGQYYLATTEDTEVEARIHWSVDEQVTATPGGRYYIEDAYAHVEPQYLPLIEATQNEQGTVTVDGRTMKITKVIPQGAPTINRYRLILKGTGGRPEL
jgi:hypothetical protein